MARLRTLLVSEPTTDGRTRHRDVLILDQLTPAEFDQIASGPMATDDAPPMLAFACDLDIPKTEDTEDDGADGGS